MARVKNRPKRERLAGLPLGEKIQLASHGEGFNCIAATVANIVHNAAYLETQKNLPAKWVGFHKQHAWQLIAKHTLEAFSRHDGTFFRDMGVAAENLCVDPAMAYVGVQIGASAAFAYSVPTVPQLVRELLRMGYKRGYRQVRRYFDYFETKPGKATRGAPRKPHKKF